MMRSRRSCLALGLLAAVDGCGPKYSPNTYSTAAVQQANKVDRGVIIGARRVDVSAPGVVGAATGGAAGGIAGSQAGGGGATSAFGALGGALIGGLVGNGVEHVAEDTFAYEYIVRKLGGDLVSVTQKDRVPLTIGAKVLVISGNQARIVPDYTTVADVPPAAPAAAPPAPPTPTAAPTQTAPLPAAVSATPLAPLPPLPTFAPSP